MIKFLLNVTICNIFLSCRKLNVKLLSHVSGAQCLEVKKGSALDSENYCCSHSKLFAIPCNTDSAHVAESVAWLGQLALHLTSRVPFFAAETRKLMAIFLNFFCSRSSECTKMDVFP